MNHCNHSKTEGAHVIFGGTACPLCELKSEATALRATVERLGKENSTLCDEVFELETAIETASNERTP